MIYATHKRLGHDGLAGLEPMPPGLTFSVDGLSSGVARTVRWVNKLRFKFITHLYQAGR